MYTDAAVAIVSKCAAAHCCNVPSILVLALPESIYLSENLHVWFSHSREGLANNFLGGAYPLCMQTLTDCLCGAYPSLLQGSHFPAA